MTEDYHEELYKLNFQENVVRGFIKLFPRGEGIEKLLFSMKDARESVEVEKTFEFIKSKISDIKLQQLREIKDIDKIRSFLENEMGDVNGLISDFNLFIKDQSAFNVEIRMLLEENKSDLKSILNVVTELLNRPDGKIDNEFLQLLFNNLFELYKVKTKNLEYDEILANINSIKKLDGYNNLDVILKEELNSYKAEIHIKLGNDKQAEELTQKIIISGVFSLKICSYLMYYATLKKDRLLFDRIFLLYPHYCSDNITVGKHLVFWNYVQQDFSGVLKILCKDGTQLEIKDEFKNSAEANFYVGMSLFELKRYKESQLFLSTASNMERSIPYKFYSQLSNAFEIIDRRAAIFLLTQSEKEILKEIYIELSSKEYTEYFARVVLDAQKDYWIQRLIITAHFDPPLALEEYNQVPESIKLLQSMKSVYADLLYFNNKFDDALKTLEELYEIEPDFNQVTKILSSYLSTGRYQSAIDFSTKLKEFDEEGVIYSLVITAFSKLNPLTESVSYAESLLPKVKYPIYIYRTLGELYSECGDMEKAFESYNLMIESIPSDDFPPRLLFAKLVRSKNFIELSLKCLKPYLDYSHEAQRLFVYDAVKSDTVEFITIANEIIDRHLTGSNEREYWLGNKVEIEYHRQHYNTCGKYLEELFRIKPSPSVAYNYAHVKVMLGDKNVLELAEILEKDKNPHGVMMAASCYFTIGDYEKAESLSLKALSLNGNTFNENLFAQFIRINLVPKPGIPDVAEIEEVSNDCVVLLESGSDLMWVGITSKPEILVSGNNYTFADTRFYFRNDENVIHFISCIKGDSVRFDNKEWNIKDIWKIKTRAVRHCIFEFTAKIPDSRFMIMIQIDSEKPLESIMPILVEGEIYDKDMLADYNFRNGIGLTLHQIARRKGRNLADAILYLIEMPNQLFYTGEVNVTNLVESKIIMSPTSIIILSLLDLFDEFTKKYKDSIVLSELTKKYFIDIVDKINTEEYGIKSTLGINDGKYFGNEFTDDLKKKRLAFFNKIIQALSYLNIVAIPILPEELDEKAKYIELISRIDYENLKFASENDHILLVDDLFIRKARGLFNKDIRTINSASILFDLLKEDIDLLMDKLELLAKGGYNFIINLHALIVVTERLFKKYKIVGQSSQYEALLNIVNISLSTPLTFQNHFKIIIDYINYLYYQKPDVRALYLIQTLLKTLWRFVNLYSIDQNILFNELGRICGNDIKKIKFFYELLSEINSDY